MSREFHFSPIVAAILGELDLVREVREICHEDGLLGNDLRNLAKYLRLQLPAKVAGLSDSRVSLSETNDGYCDLKLAAIDKLRQIIFGFQVKLDPTFRSMRRDFPLDEDPCIYLQICTTQPNRDYLVRCIKQCLPSGFTDSGPLSPRRQGNVIWRYVPLRRFVKSQQFDTSDLVREIVRSFEKLATLLPVIEACLCSIESQTGISGGGVSH